MASDNGFGPFNGIPLVRSVARFGEELDRQAKSRLEAVRGTTLEALEQLEAAFMQRVLRILNALQIPTARDVRELNERVEALQRAVLALERRKAEESAAARPRSTRGTRRKQATHPAPRAPEHTGKQAGN